MDRSSIAESIFSIKSSPLSSPTLSHHEIVHPGSPIRPKGETYTTEYNIRRNSVFVDKNNSARYETTASPVKRHFAEGRYSFFNKGHKEDNSRPEDVLKVKIFTQDNVLAVKLRKDKLNNVQELIQVVCMKINRKPKDLLLSFKDRELSSMSLTDDIYADLIMDYVALKEKIYIFAV